MMIISMRINKIFLKKYMNKINMNKIKVKKYILFNKQNKKKNQI